jgi:hypothetical protein
MEQSDKEYSPWSRFNEIDYPKARGRVLQWYLLKLCFVQGITSGFYKKHKWKNFDFHVTFRHHQSYNIVAEYIYNYLTDLEMNNTSELLIEIL